MVHQFFHFDITLPPSLGRALWETNLVDEIARDAAKDFDLEFTGTCGGPVLVLNSQGLEGHRAYGIEPLERSQAIPANHR